LYYTRGNKILRANIFLLFSPSLSLSLNAPFFLLLLQKWVFVSVSVLHKFKELLSLGLGMVFGDLPGNGEGRLLVGMEGKHLITAWKKVDPVELLHRKGQM
jgi:hypothetical protein